MERLDFDAAIARALDKNPTVAIAANNILRSEALLQQARSSTLPAAGITITNSTLDKGRTFDEFTVQPRNQTLLAANLYRPGSSSVAMGGPDTGRRSGGNRPVYRSSMCGDRLRWRRHRPTLPSSTLKRQVEVSLRALDTARAQLDYNQKRVQGGVGTRIE
jgi:outer membrane protein TolC